MRQEEWEDLFRELTSGLEKIPRDVLLVLPASSAPVRSWQVAPSPEEVSRAVLEELGVGVQAVTLSAGMGDAPYWACAASRDTVQNALRAAWKAGVRVVGVVPSWAVLLRALPRVSGLVLVAAAGPGGAEIACGIRTSPVLARSILTRGDDAGEAAREVELTLRYLEREGFGRAEVLLAGPLAGAVKSMLQDRGIQAGTYPTGESVAGSIASLALEIDPKGVDFISALQGRAAVFGRVAAAAAAAALLLSACHALVSYDRVARVREEVASLRLERDLLSGELSKWKSPAMLAASRALAILESKKTRLDLLARLPSMVPDDLWIERLDARPGEVRIEGRALSRASVLAFAKAARNAWHDAHLVSVERADEPGTSYRFVVDVKTYRLAPSGRPSGGGP